MNNIENSTFFYALAIAIVIFIIVLVIINRKIKKQENSTKEGFTDDIPDSYYCERSNLSSPYVIRIKNPSTENKTAILFGYNKYFCKNNFGSDKEIILISAIPTVDYCEMLTESAFFPFSIGRMRLISQNIEQLKEVIKYNCKSANGRAMEMPIFMHEAYKESEQNGAVQKQINEIVFPNEHIYEINISCKDFLVFNILPETELDVFISLKKQVSDLHPLISPILRTIDDTKIANDNFNEINS